MFLYDDGKTFLSSLRAKIEVKGSGLEVKSSQFHDLTQVGDLT